MLSFTVCVCVTSFVGLIRSLAATFDTSAALLYYDRKFCPKLEKNFKKVNGYFFLNWLF